MAARRREVTRRTVLRGAALATTALAGAPIARTTHAAATKESAYVPTPNATQYALAVAATSIDPDGTQPAPAILANGGLPGPEIRVREGELLRILVENHLTDAPTSIHWHGILVPAAMDGVPDVSNVPIPPKRTYIYEYPIRQTGTYWYHSHVGYQEQMGCYGAFIIEPTHEPLKSDRDAVVLLGDWLHRNPADVFAALRASAPPADDPKMSSAMNMGGTKPAPAPAATAMAMNGAMKMDMAAASAAPGAMKTGAMKMGGGADLSDVEYDAFLLNGRGPADPWKLEVRSGERVRLRLINGGASTYFRVRLDGHPLEVTHADGLAVQPVKVDHLLMGMGETYDVVVKIDGRGSHTLHGVAQDGSGQALGILYTQGVAPTPNRAMPTFAGRELTYADLRAPAPTTLPQGPLRTFRLPLTGDMARYVWMIGGQMWPQADRLLIKRGDRVQIEMPNQTMMYHPMHLHGHFFRVLQGAGEYCPLKHTVSVAPGETMRIEFTADNPGSWFFHCHNTYHLEAGMAREIEYEV